MRPAATRLHVNKSLSQKFDRMATIAAGSLQPAHMPSAQIQGRIFAQFRSQEGEVQGPQLEIPLDLTPKQLNAVLNELLGNERSEPYSFFVNDQVLHRQSTVRHVTVDEAGRRRSAALSPSSSRAKSSPPRKSSQSCTSRRSMSAASAPAGGGAADAAFSGHLSRGGGHPLLRHPPRPHRGAAPRPSQSPHIPRAQALIGWAFLSPRLRLLLKSL